MVDLVSHQLLSVLISSYFKITQPILMRRSTVLSLNSQPRPTCKSNTCHFCRQMALRLSQELDEQDLENILEDRNDHSRQPLHSSPAWSRSPGANIRKLFSLTFTKMEVVSNRCQR
jgi:hypothetical protein